MKRRPQGFTLLEIMVAMAFIGIALVSIISVQGQAVKVTDQARLTSRSVFLARWIMAEVRNKQDFSEGVERGKFEEPLDYLAWERRIIPLPFVTGLYKIVVRVFPEGRPVQEGLMLEGFAYQDPG